MLAEGSNITISIGGKKVPLKTSIVTWARRRVPIEPGAAGFERSYEFNLSMRLKVIGIRETESRVWIQCKLFHLGCGAARSYSNRKRAEKAMKGYWARHVCPRRSR